MLVAASHRARSTISPKRSTSLQLDRKWGASKMPHLEPNTPLGCVDFFCSRKIDKILRSQEFYAEMIR